MLFNSGTFFVFFAVVYGLYIVLNHRQQNRWLLLASACFYGLWSLRALALLFASIAVDYRIGQLIDATDDPRRRKTWLTVGLIKNLGLLAFFKYYGFMVDTLAPALSGLGLDPARLHLNIILPIGISFYSFHMISYLLDVHDRRVAASHRFVDFALFVTYFPQLVSGPIARAGSLLPQVQRERTITPKQLEDGLYLFGIGLFKKVVIADGCAYVVDAVFGHDAAYHGLDKLIAIYAFAFQIYGDFSGYSDMARGLAKLMGFELTLNFDLPYFAVNIQEFWRRWHISLTTWLGDYFFTPLRMKLRDWGDWGLVISLFSNMLLIGFWHGPRLTYLAFGALHGLYLCVSALTWRQRNRFFKARPTLATIRRVAGPIVLFHLTCFGWLVFRAENGAQVAAFLRDIFTDFRPTATSLSYAKLVAELAVPLVLFEWWQFKQGTLEIFERWSAPKRAGFAIAVVWLAALFFVLHRSMVQREIPFVYFQF